MWSTSSGRNIPFSSTVLFRSSAVGDGPCSRLTSPLMMTGTTRCSSVCRRSARSRVRSSAPRACAISVPPTMVSLRARVTRVAFGSAVRVLVGSILVAMKAIAVPWDGSFGSKIRIRTQSPRMMVMRLSPKQHRRHELWPSLPWLAAALRPHASRVGREGRELVVMQVKIAARDQKTGRAARMPSDVRAAFEQLTEEGSDV